MLPEEKMVWCIWEETLRAELNRLYGGAISESGTFLGKLYSEALCGLILYSWHALPWAGIRFWVRAISLAKLDSLRCWYLNFRMLIFEFPNIPYVQRNVVQQWAQLVAQLASYQQRDRVQQCTSNEPSLSWTLAKLDCLRCWYLNLCIW